MLMASFALNLPCSWLGIRSGCLRGYGCMAVGISEMLVLCVHALVSIITDLLTITRVNSVTALPPLAVVSTYHWHTLPSDRAFS